MSVSVFSVILLPIRHMNGQQSFEQFPVVGHTQMQQLVDNYKILKSKLMIG